MDTRNPEIWALRKVFGTGFLKPVGASQGSSLEVSACAVTDTLEALGRLIKAQEVELLNILDSYSRNQILGVEVSGYIRQAGAGALLTVANTIKPASFLVMKDCLKKSASFGFFRIKRQWLYRPVSGARQDASL